MRCPGRLGSHPASVDQHSFGQLIACALVSLPACAFDEPFTILCIQVTSLCACEFPACELRTLADWITIVHAPLIVDRFQPGSVFVFSVCHILCLVFLYSSSFYSLRICRPGQVLDMYVLSFQRSTCEARRSPGLDQSYVKTF